MRLLSILACSGMVGFASVSMADELPGFGFYPSGAANFRDALDGDALAREMTLNVAPASDLLRAARVKAGNPVAKASVSIFGSIYNNLGSPLCALVLANGQFMFSCQPTGQYSLTVPQDSNGQVTLFGFADGHFPYKQIFGGAGGRYDMLLNVATTTTPPPAQNETITFNITDGCNNGISIDYKFYDETNNLVWPSATSYYYTSALNATYTSNLTCINGANVCYGARTTVNGTTIYWGVDLDNSKSCTNCCISCTNGNTLSRTLTC
jgi:hypothetical protein